MFKSKLEELCQKCGLARPFYASEKGGPDHCPRFTATVSVNGTLFHTPSDGCRLSKEAHNSAAQVAFEFLSGVGTYGHVALPPSPVSSSLPRAPSTIVAIEPTKEVPQQNNAGNIQSNDKVNVKPIASSTIVAIEPTQEVPQQNSGGIIQSNDKVNVKPPDGGEGCSRTVATGTDGKGSAPILGCGVIADTLQNNNPKRAEKIEYRRGKAEGYEENAKRYKCSDESIHHQLPETFGPLPALSNAFRSSLPSVKSVETRCSGFQDSKILIIHCGSGVEVPKDASVLHDSEGWMAVEANPAQD